jgi:hypothetical protein
MGTCDGDQVWVAAPVKQAIPAAGHGPRGLSLPFRASAGLPIHERVPLPRGGGSEEIAVPWMRRQRRPSLGRGESRLRLTRQAPPWPAGSYQYIGEIETVAARRRRRE